MSEIKAEVSTTPLEVKTRRVVTVLDINFPLQEINVHYEETKYYLNGEGAEIILSTLPDTWAASFDKWFNNAAGSAIRAQIEAELLKEVPGSVED